MGKPGKCTVVKIITTRLNKCVHQVTARDVPPGLNAEDVAKPCEEIRTCPLKERGRAMIRTAEDARRVIDKHKRRSKAYWSAFVADLQRDLGKSDEKPINAVQLTLLLFHAGRYPVMSWNVRDWRRGKCIPWRAAQNKMIRLRKCLNALGDMVVREDRFKFFLYSHPLLEKKSPAQFLDNTPGMKRVLALLDSLESGAYA